MPGLVLERSNVPPAQPNEQPRDEHGVDLTLIDEMQRLTVMERLQLNDRSVNAVLKLRDGFKHQP